MRRLLITLVAVLVLASSALAATNCQPPSGQDWIVNSTNSTVICDNGTTVNLGSYALILHDNATITFTNSTTLNANNITVSSATSSLTFDGSFMNATLLLSDGTVTFLDGASLHTTPSITGGTVLRVYPLFVVNQTGNPVANRSVAIRTDPLNPATQLWSGTTDNNGYAEPNLTYTNTTANATFYLVLPDLGDQSVALTLLNDTPLNWSVRANGPFGILHATQGNITKGSFGYNATVSNDTMNVTVTITNATTTWSNLSWNNTQLASLGWSLSQTYDGMLLPAGNWTLTVTAKNQTGGSNITTATFQSLPTLRTTLTSANAQETSIGGDDVTFTFNVTVKSAGSVVEAYLLLASGGYTFDARNALLSDNVTTNVSVAGNGAYTGAENITLPSITTAPAYVTMNLAATGEIRQDLLTLTLTPYATLIPGTYTGSYGFGVFG